MTMPLQVLVVYESMFGNTQQIAAAVAAGLAGQAQVELIEVSSAPTSIGDDLDLLVVGGPTHAHGMSGPGTRRSAMDHAIVPVVSGRIGVRDWFDSLRSRPGVLAAAFDTRFNQPRWLTGSAAQRIATRLRQHGYRMLVPPESFCVLGMSGPLLDGELDRARGWGSALGIAIRARLSRSAPARGRVVRP